MNGCDKTARMMPMSAVKNMVLLLLLLFCGWWITVSTPKLAFVHTYTSPRRMHRSILQYWDIWITN